MEKIPAIKGPEELDRIEESETSELKKSTAQLKEAVISVTAILNKFGQGEVYFGIKNDGRVVGQDVSETTIRKISQAISENIEPTIYPKVEKLTITGKNCIHVVFQGIEKPYFAYGKAYIRIGEEDRQLYSRELGKFFLQKNQYPSPWERDITQKTAKSIDSKIFQEFLVKARHVRRLRQTGRDAISILEKLNILSNSNLTRAAELLFCNDNTLEVQAAVFAGNDKTTFLDIQKFEGTLFSILKKSEKYILEKIYWHVKIDKLERDEIPEIPLPAIREALINSLCHWDYVNPKGNEIAIFKNRIEIYNPGSFPEGLTPEDFLTGRERSYLRNPLIAETLYKTGDIEKWGSGLKRIDNVCKKAQIKTDFQLLKTGFLVTFYRKVMVNGSPKSSPKTENIIIQLMQSDKHITTESIAESIGISKRAVLKQIYKLKKQGKLKRIGPSKGGYWEVF